MAVFYVFIDMLNAPDSSQWWGPLGTVASIVRTLEIPFNRRQVVRRVLTTVVDMAKQGLVYDGERKASCRDINIMIAPDSFDRQIIADAMEGGFGLRHTQELVNEHRRDSNKTIVGLNTVWVAYVRMNPVVTPIGKRKQGTTDPQSPWAMARLQFVTQILVRFGLLAADRVLNEQGNLPDKFNVAKLTKMTINQIAFWDETHKKVRIGKVGANGVKFQVRFKRTPEGKVDPENGTCLAKEGTQLNMKYSEEVRLCLGVAKVKQPDGTDLGVRLPLFDYSGKVILTIKDFDKKLVEEQQRVKNLIGCAPWVVNNRGVGDFWEGESLVALKGIGTKTAEKLAEKGIGNIGDLKHCSDQQLKLLKGVGTGIAKLTVLRLQVAGAFPGDPPGNLLVNHKNNPEEPNPYKSRFGDLWLDEIKKSTFLSKFVCIKDLVKHIYTETKKCFANTEYSNDFFFYHDALSLMTANDTVAWMKEENIYKHWFLPELDVNAGTCYQGRPIGNSPEMMPLDASLNKDVDDGVHSHIVFTNGLAPDNPQKFCMTTPVRGSFAYRRVWNSPVIAGSESGEIDPGGTPSSTRIIQDIDKFTTSCMSIYNHKGTVVPGLGTRNGHRHEAEAKNKGQIGGARTKKQDSVSTKFIHPDARGSRQNLLLESKKRFSGDKDATFAGLEGMVSEQSNSDSDDDESTGNMENDYEEEIVDFPPPDEWYDEMEE
jgi:hypothetical protein